MWALWVSWCNLVPQLPRVINFAYDLCFRHVIAHWKGISYNYTISPLDFDYVYNLTVASQKNNVLLVQWYIEGLLQNIIAPLWMYDLSTCEEILKKTQRIEMDDEGLVNSSSDEKILEDKIT
jgi:hypothetical protein